MLLKHPKGLRLLFATEMWERFSFYCMRALLVLYIAAKTTEGGLGWTKSEAISLYGTYISIAYLTPLIGGYLADRFLGQRRAAMIGAVLMSFGHFFMAINDITIFYAALALIAIGNGFFKPCLTSILGELYDDSEESQRDSAYSLFYMGINIGAIISSFVSGWMMESYGFDYGFTIAGFAMVIALLIFWWGKDRYLGEAGKYPQVKLTNHLAPSLTKEEKSRICVIIFLFLMTTFFFAAWDQGGGLIPLFIQDSIDRSIGSWIIPTTWLAHIDPLFIVALAPTLSIFWLALGKKNKDPYLGAKLGIGFFFMAVAFILLGWISSTVDTGNHQPHWIWIVLVKLFIVLGELCVVPISWAAVTKLAPKSYTTRLMGLMLAGVGLGSYLASYFGAFVDQVGATVIFYWLSLGLIICGGLCFVINDKLKKLSHIPKVKDTF